jgi:hypothetical protein
MEYSLGMNKGDAQDLWASVLGFAAAVGEVRGEGNSGEFHNDQYALEAKQELTVATQTLVMRFWKATNYQPVFQGEDADEADAKSWTLVRRKPI